MENYSIYKKETENKIEIFIFDENSFCEKFAELIETCDKNLLDDGFQSLKEALHYARLYRAGYQVAYPNYDVQIIIPNNVDNK